MRVEPSGEEGQIREIARLLSLKVESSAGEGGLFRRDAHPKHHGIVKAWFEVGTDVPPALRHGIFAEPHTYAAWIRLSNGNPAIRSDSRADQRGFAIKVMGVPGEKILADEQHTQDFVLTSAPRFFIRTVAEYVEFTSSVVKEPAFRVLGFFLFKWRLYEFKALVASMTKDANVLAIRYWSQTPYRLGPHVVKYSAIPKSPDPGFPPDGSPDYLRGRLAAQLRAGDAAFDFAVQVQTDPATMPIDDATVLWPEASAPFQKVATIRIPRQEFQSPAQMALAECISMTAWHTLPAHEPLGAVNRTRRVVYETVANLRRRLNGVAPFEPVGHDTLGGFPVSIAAPTPARTGRARRLVLTLIAIAAVIFLASALWAFWPVTKNLPEALAYPPPPSGQNGLTAVERQQYYHLTEGGELYPMAWLLALETAVEAPDGTVRLRPFLENIERFGLIPDPPSQYNPYGLPVGITIGNSQVSGLQMMGINCAACHVGEIHYHDKRFRVDGGPNIAFINRFVQGMFDETVATGRSLSRLTRFLDRRRHVKLVRVPNFPIVDKEDVPVPDVEPNEGIEGPLNGFTKVLEGLRQALWVNSGLLHAKLANIKTARLVNEAILIGTLDGYGRADAFGVGRNELFGGFSSAGFTRGLNAVPPDAPVSFPHLWGIGHTSWFQWGVNTNSVTQRNIGQTLGVGSTFDDQNRSTARLDHLYAMERLTYQLTAPAWPADIFGPIDQAKAARGRAIFDKTCALCHETYTSTNGINEYQLFPLDVVGTDPGAALNFERTVMTAAGPKPFGTAAFEIVDRVKDTYYKEHNVSPEVQAKWEDRPRRPAGAFRSPLREWDQWPDTNRHGVYRAKTLKGIWATAPYLHNGSVPTIYDLLLPDGQRPTMFRTGTRQYDPDKLGYVTSGDRYLVPERAEPFTLDTYLPGNYNTGHEWWFYATLTDKERYDIIEFLKTFTEEGDYKPASSDKLPPEVRARYPG